MRISIEHRTVYSYEEPPTYVIQTLRMTPRPHAGQLVRRWRTEVEPDVHVHEMNDSFGNIVHTFTIAEPINQLAVAVAGIVETTDTNGIVSGTREVFPPSLFLRETTLTAPGPDIRAFAADTAGSGGDLDRLHGLMAAVGATFSFDIGRTDVAIGAAEAFRRNGGVCQDYAHVMIAAARSLGIPARYVGGYFVRDDGIVEQDAGHAWMEGWTGEELGWVGFDPVNAICVTDQHVRVATGLDYQDAAPVRGSRHGGASEEMAVSLHVAQAGRSSSQQ